jgi:hypothetical protein
LERAPEEECRRKSTEWADTISGAIRAEMCKPLMVSSIGDLFTPSDPLTPFGPPIIRADNECYQEAANGGLLIKRVEGDADETDRRKIPVSPCRC